MAISAFVIWMEVRFDIFMPVRTGRTRVAVLMGFAYGVVGAGAVAGIGTAFTFSSLGAAVGAAIGAALGFGFAYRYALRRS